MEEIWKPVVGYEGWYEVSDQGRVRNCRPRPRTHVGRIINTNNHRRYARVSLVKQGKKTEKSVHVVVAEAFIGQRPEGMHIDHVDGNRYNNKANNLEYVTPIENDRRSREMGLQSICRGTKISNSILNEKAVLDIRKTLKGGATPGSLEPLAKKYGVSKATICNVHKRVTWSWL